MYQNWLICISVMNWRCTKIGTLTFKGLKVKRYDSENLLIKKYIVEYIEK